ncbi:MAG: Arm DNA-binding domain-containing protein, partial [Vulcanimicrobiaceae bacterium]
MIEYPRDPKTGKRVRKWTEGFATRKEAEAERDRLRSTIANGIDITPRKLTVSALIDQWLASKVKLSPLTREMYELLGNRTKTQIGSILVAKLRPAHIQQLYAKLCNECRVCTLHGDGLAPQHKCKPPLSSTSVRHLHGLLKEVCGWAVRMEIIARNPVDVLSKDDVPSRAAPKVDAYTDDEVLGLLDASQTTRFDNVLLLAIATGMRRGELAALRRQEDIRIERDEDGNEHGS